MGDDAVEVGGEGEGVEDTKGGHSKGGEGGGPVKREGAVPEGGGVAGAEVGSAGADEGGEGGTCAPTLVTCDVRCSGYAHVISRSRSRSQICCEC